MRCSILFHFDVPGGKWQTQIAIWSSSASFCSSTFHRTGAAGVRAAAVGVDGERGRVRVALAAEVLPPRADRVDRERAGVVRDANADHPLVGVDVVHAVGDRVPQLLVLEIVAANLDRPPARFVLSPHCLEIPDQLALLGVYGYHGLLRGERGACRLADMPKLRVAVRMILALPRLGVRVQPEPEPSQELPGRPVRDLMPGRLKRIGNVLQALRAPPQRRARIATRIRIDQRLKRPEQLRIRVRQPRTPCTRTTHPPRIQPRSVPQLHDPTPHSVLADPRRTHHRRDPAWPARPSLGRRPQPALALIQLRAQPCKTLRNLRFIDHALAIRHHTPTSCHSALNLS
jgi:hypothetical protein